MGTIFQRSKNNPILKSDENHSWENFKVYNPAAIFEDGKYHLFYRTMNKNWDSSIGYAVSDDGENFKRFEKPILKPENAYETKGVEDPRVVKIDGRYLMAYTGYDGKTARLCIATSSDMYTWQKHGKIFKEWNMKKGLGFLERIRIRFAKDWCKAGALFPEKINGKYWMLFGEPHIWFAHSNDGIEWTPVQKPFLSVRKNYFDSSYLEAGPPVIKTDRGWLFLYHGVDKKKVYRLGYVLLDLHDPTKIISRSSQPIFEPMASYELKGVVDALPGGWKIMAKMNDEELKNYVEKNIQKGKMPLVAFVCGAVLVGKELRIYYGASDMVICTATANLENILSLT